jgi:hypothetical protein
MASDLPAVLRGAKTGRNGRDPATGRFLPGNAGGGRPANPFARYQAELRKALVAEVTPADVRAVMRQVVKIAKRGHLPAVDLLLRWTLGGPPPAIDPDFIEAHEQSVKRSRPTLIEALALGEAPDPEDLDDAPAGEAEAEAHDPLTPSLRQTLAWALEELAQAQTALRTQPSPPSPQAGWERFAASRLEFAPEAAVDVDMLLLAYMRWCGGRGEPVLTEGQVLAWLTAQGASVHTGPLSQVTAVHGVRVMA